jgi:hypothetical protein
MRKRTSVLAASLSLSFLPSGPALAAPLASASLEVSLGTPAAIFPTFPGPGASGTATGPLAATLAAGSGFAGTETLLATTASSALDKIRLVVGQNQAGIFSGALPSQLGGSALFTADASLFLSVSDLSPVAVLPIRIGTTTAFWTKDPSGLQFSVFAAPWTAGQAAVTGISLAGGVMTLTVTGMNALSPGGGGSLTLVSPGRVWASTGNKLPLIATLTLTYNPEPGTGLLLGVGTVALGIAGRRRARSTLGRTP